METSTVKFVGNAAVVTTILQFLSGVFICRQYIANKSTGESTPLPFICCVLSCALWLYYGMLKNDSNVINVNFVGVLLMSGYTIIFYMFTIKKSLVLKQCLAVGSIFILVVLVATRIEDAGHLLYFIGLIASLFTLATIGAPLSKLFYVIKVKNTECLPFPLLVMSFIVSILWMLYGHLIEDGFVKCVNVVGAGLAVAQLSLFVIYPRKPQSLVLPKHMRI